MASQGPNSPTSVIDNATVGTLTWNNPGNAAAEDNVYATAGISGTSHYLWATDFGFSIPAGSTINGIVAEIKRYSDFNLVDFTRDSGVYLITASSTLGTENKADTLTNWPTSVAYKTYGSSSDLWSGSWSADDINSANFGFALSAIMTQGDVGTNGLVDHMRITVYYTEPTTESFNIAFV